MEKELSEDSYCTTDEENNDEKEEGYQSDTEEVSNTDHVGMTLKVKNKNIIKEILQVGSGKDKPIEIDSVVVTIKFILDGEPIEVESLTMKQTEIALNWDDNFELDENNKLTKSTENNLYLPKALNLAIQEMRKGEISKVLVKPAYIFKHFDKIKNQISLDNIFLKEEFRNKFKESNLNFEITLHDFVMYQNLMDRGEIRKKIIRNGKGWKYARLPDFVNYNLSCYYDGKLIYDRKDCKMELDQDSTLFEIERRVIQNVKIGELAEVSVKPSYMKDKNPEFLKTYSIDNSKNIIFKCEVLRIDVKDYVFKPDKDKISKKYIIRKGFGRDTPDRESIVSLKVMVKIDNKIVYNNFDCENIFDYYDSYENLRDKLNIEFNIKNLDDDEDYERDGKIFNKVALENPTLNIVDLRDYTVPLVMRKVIIHMKRNEVCQIKTNFMDSFELGNCELSNVKGDIEIYIHLYEFLHRKEFTASTIEDIFSQLNHMKETANGLFKQGRYYRAGKIYTNINYRFNDGQVKIDKISDQEMIKKVKELRLSSSNNLANVKFKQGRFHTVYNVTAKVLSEIDQLNHKAMFLHGKSCIGLRLYEQSVKILTKLNEIAPGIEEFKAALVEAQKIHQSDIQKQKNMYKKMIFS